MDTLTQVLDMFAIDWPKLIAQAILFLAIYTVLSKFAFKPVVAMLEERRKRIEQGQANAETIKRQLAEAESRHAEILTRANADAERILNEARASSETLAEKRQQEAIADAARVLANAREATTLERDRLMAELKAEIGRLVVDTTAKVAGKVLTPEDQKRLNEETLRHMAA